jgi:hypothetical protein
MSTWIKRTARSALLAGAAILGTASLVPAPARTQSAEETVAFMLWGLEAGASTKRLLQNRWQTQEDDGGRSSFSVQRLTDCVFRVSYQARRAGVPDVLEFEHVLNFAAVHDFRAWFANGRDQRIIVKIEGQRWYSKTVRSKTTGRVVQNTDSGNVDVYVANGGSVERLESAFSRFRSAFCRGRSLHPDEPAQSE